MKQLILAAVSIGSLAAATPASAQGIPVFDSTSVLKHIEQIQKTMQMIEQGRQQIAEAQQLYQGLNQLTDVSSIANQLKTDSLRTLGVDVNSLERMARGEDVDPALYYMRATPWFETASEKYRFLNRIVCVSTGRRDPAGPVYEVFQIL